MGTTSEAVEGVDIARVTGWFEANIDGVEPPLAFALIPGGHSNLTFDVIDAAGGRFVLRRPPLRQVLATAHDMAREHRIIAALGPTDVPVPPALGLCTDPEVTGAPFYVMAHVEGNVIRDVKAARALLDVDGRGRASESLVDVLARIHSVDPAAVGLGDLGRTEGYIARQLKRWHGQWEQSKTRELPAVDEVHDRLRDRIPDQGAATIVHGDYRLDNCVVDEWGRVVAVLDWEICTLGDPLADVGLLLVYWTEPDDEVSALLDGATAVEGFASRAEVLARYAARSGREVSAIDFYVAFAYWKLACILEGVYARYVGGAMGAAGGQTAGFEAFGQRVEMLAEQAADAAARLR
jgi:aminoglycoside phosphotransferase (APT) family kinase protein